MPHAADEGSRVSVAPDGSRVTLQFTPSSQAAATQETIVADNMVVALDSLFVSYSGLQAVEVADVQQVTDQNGRDHRRL